METLSQPKNFKESFKILEADIQHANNLAMWCPREYDGVYFQMRVAYSPAAPFALFLVKWADCSLAGALGLIHILIYKVHMNGSTTMAIHEKRASLREFYGYIYPSLKQLHCNLTETELSRQKALCEVRFPKAGQVFGCLTEREQETQREIDRECGICMENEPRVGLPGCVHAMCLKCYKTWQSRSSSCPFCRDALKRVQSEDLWVFMETNEAIDLKSIQKENLHRLLVYIDKLPVVFADNVFAVYDARYR